MKTTKARGKPQRYSQVFGTGESGKPSIGKAGETIKLKVVASLSGWWLPVGRSRKVNSIPSVNL